jgi:hypothetical protein
MRLKYNESLIKYLNLDINQYYSIEFILKEIMAKLNQGNNRYIILDEQLLNIFGTTYNKPNKRQLRNYIYNCRKIEPPKPQIKPKYDFGKTVSFIEI